MKNLNSMQMLLLVGVAALGTTACSQTDSDATGPLAARAAQDPDAASPQAAISEPSSQPYQEREESWMSCYINGTRIGYSHTIIEPTANSDGQQLRFTNEQTLTIKRFQTDTVISTRLTSLETRSGQVLSFSSELNAGGGPMKTEGEYDDGKLVIRTLSQGTTETSTLPVGPNVGGFFSDQRAMREKPLKPGETRRLKALQPIVNQVGDIQLEAVAYEATDLMTATKQLLRVNLTVGIGTAKLRSTLWSDDKGIVWKLRDEQIGMEAYLTSRQDALVKSQGGNFDLGLSTIVRIKRRLKDPHATKQIVYLARLSDGDVQPLLSNGGSQRVKPLDDGVVEVTVTAVRPDSALPVETPKSERPKEADRSSTAMVQCNDPLVVEMAGAVAANETDPWALACALEKHVKQSITMKNYSQAMATAAEVARSREGDCTEHAMLLAALCRARKIPARVAIGLVYYPAAGGFAYHMWSEVWIKDRWVPMDATLGQGGIGAAHLKFSHSSLEGSAAFAEMLPVIQAVGKLQLEIESVEY